MFSKVEHFSISFLLNRHKVYKAPSKSETKSAFITASDLNGIGILVTNSGHSKFGQVCSHLNPKDERCLKEWVKIVSVIRKRQFLQETLLINVYLQFQHKIVGKCLSVLFYC